MRVTFLNYGGSSAQYLLADYFPLTKPRLLLIVLFSSMIGYILPPESGIGITLLHLLVGTALTGGGAHALNQWQERAPDGLMRRTRKRPLPSGRLEAEEVLGFGLFLSAAGVFYLWAAVNLQTAFLGGLTLVSYVLVYTPLKRMTVLNTWFGALTGALPPLMGWAAQQGSLGMSCLPIFAILYFWQLPHFFAVSWMYRDEYARGGFRMLSRGDPQGRKTGMQMLVNGFFLLFSSMMLFLSGQAGFWYLAVALVSGLGFMAVIYRFFREPGFDQAKRVFQVSLVYLPAMSTMIVVDRLFLQTI